MSQNIASLVETSNALDTMAKFVRVMEKAGVSLEQLILPINDRAARGNLAQYLMAGCPQVGAVAAAVPREFSTWRTIQIGGKSKDELLTELKAAGITVGDWAKDIMGKEAFTTLSETQTVNLARVKVRNLGFTKQPTTMEIWARIRELGHELCPAEVGPHLCLQYQDQPRGDYFWLAMEQIADSDGGPLVFFVGRDGVGERWLDTHWTNSGSRWGLDRGIVFRPRM